MPLPYTTRRPLDIPEDAFNDDGLAKLVLQGNLFGGDWTINAASPEHVADSFGALDTSNTEHPDLVNDPRYPHLAVESAFIWLREQAEAAGLRVVFFESLNSHYGEREARFFCAAQALVASPAFVPSPGVVYADQQTLDQVMAAG